MSGPGWVQLGNGSPMKGHCYIRPAAGFRSAAQRRTRRAPNTINQARPIGPAPTTAPGSVANLAIESLEVRPHRLESGTPWRQCNRRSAAAPASRNLLTPSRRWRADRWSPALGVFHQVRDGRIQPMRMIYHPSSACACAARWCLRADPATMAVTAMLPPPVAAGRGRVAVAALAPPRAVERPRMPAVALASPVRAVRAGESRGAPAGDGCRCCGWPDTRCGQHRCRCATRCRRGRGGRRCATTRCSMAAPARCAAMRRRLADGEALPAQACRAPCTAPGRGLCGGNRSRQIGLPMLCCGNVENGPASPTCRNCGYLQLRAGIAQNTRAGMSPWWAGRR